MEAKTQKLLELLVLKERPGLIFSVSTEFQRLYREYHKILSIEISTAQPLNSILEDKIRVQLEAEFKGKIELTKQVDPDLIGGLMVRIGDRRYDGTIRKSLIEAKKSLLDKRFQNQY